MYTKSVHRSSHAADALGIPQRTLSFYEREAGYIPAGLAPPMARALGVSVDEFLGETDKKRRAAVGPTGRMRRLFEVASKLPRSQQEKIVAVIAAFVNQHSYREAWHPPRFNFVSNLDDALQAFTQHSGAS